MSFKDKTIVITGGGSGIGAQIVRDLYSEGAIVCILGRTKDKLDGIMDEVLRDSEEKGKLFTFVCDVSQYNQVEHVFAQIIDQGLSISGLVNNAGINPSRNNILNTSPADWNATINTNLTGAYHCSKAAVRHMVDCGGGSIVNISSIASLTALEDRAAYMSSKWGLAGLTQSIALDFAEKNIRANCVCPGYVKTPLVSQFLNSLPSDRYEGLLGAHPMKRLGEPKDISNAVLFLLSDESSWITGAQLPVDGGYCVGKEY